MQKYDTFPLTRELRALHGACATPRSSSILEKTDRSSARSICRGLVPKIFTPFRCNGAARLFGICPPTDTMLPEQPWRGKDGRYNKRMTSEESRKDRRRGDALSCLWPPARKLSASFKSLNPVAISNYSGKPKETNVDLSCATSLVITRNNVSVCGVHVCVWPRVCNSLIKACNPFYYRTDPEGKLFLWQCQVVSLHYSWACAPGPVQGLSSCSNAIFIIHIHKAREDCCCEKGIDGNAISPKQTHT